MKLGIIGATGWLGTALGTRLLAQGWPQEALLLMNRSAPRDAYAAWPGVRWVTDAATVSKGAEVVVLSVRPGDFPMPGYGPGPRLVVSFMTAWSLERLAALHPGAGIVRAMPNSGAPLGQSFTPWVAGPGLSDADRALVRRLLAAMGDEAEVASEDQLDYLSALSGSGAAYPALMAQAMLDHAAGQGLPPDVAQRAVASVLASGGAMAPDVAAVGAMLAAYHGYRGITAAGLRAAEAAGLPHALAAALDAARDHARTMTRDGV
jgi:pyrroline-5-carboxylate reductase